MASVSDNILISGRTATSIMVTWTSAGSEAVHYVVSWKTATLGGCSRSGSSDARSISLDPIASSYNLTGLEEGSCHIVTLTAFLAHNSIDVNITTAVTLDSGGGYLLLKW